MIEFINAIKILGIEMINKANSGHPGIVLGAASIIYTLFTKHVRVNPDIDKWINRDRFVLSAGHGSALLYSILHLSGFNISVNDLKCFRQLNSITPGHPEYNLTPGIDATTGPLGQGFVMGIGMALAETFLAKKYNKKKYNLFDHYTYVLCSDGDLQEGVTQEGISLAGHWKLNKLIVLFDSNDVQLDNIVNIAQSENIKNRFQAANWNYILVKNGNNIEDIDKAIQLAKLSKAPTLIEIKTIIGLDSIKEGTHDVHGMPLNDDDIKNIKTKFNWLNKEFEISNIIYKNFEIMIKKRGILEYSKWLIKYQKYLKLYPLEGTELQKILKYNFKIFEKDFLHLIPKNPQATRISSGMILQQISKLLPNIIGGSADLSISTKVKGTDGYYHYNNRLGRNIAYGVREFAMAAINNGIYLHGGLIPFSGSFLVFADYMKPAIRLSSLMKIPVIYIFSHDSVAIGEDGPTHQPIEQLVMLRSQHNLNIFRPCDFKETLGSYILALQEKYTPSIILTTRQNVVELKQSNLKMIKKGGYKIYGKTKNNKVIIFATGSEVSLAINIAKKLQKHKIDTKVISMICWEIFDKQNQKYKNKLIEKNSLKVSIELSSTFGWEKYTGNEGLNFGINEFGKSCPYKDIILYYNFNVNYIVNKILQKINF